VSRILPGRRYPLGATWDGGGVNFAVYSERAARVLLCLFDEPGAAHATQSIELPEKTAHVWHGYLPGVSPGQLYGYRAEGPFDPLRGFRFNPAKLLIDPYARALAGELRWGSAIFGYPFGHPDADLARSDEDSAGSMQKCVVCDDRFDWEDDRPPDTPLNRTILYETHVRGLTMRHPEVPDELRGTYAGLACPPIIAYLKQLGVSAVELLPVHDFADEGHLLDRGMRNYWGYNTTNFFAPTARYSASGDRGGQVREFKEMVKALHRAGIEVILDVVYNHTSEGNELGPTLSFKGLANRTYYRLVRDQPRYYMNYTGTGNTLNSREPQVLKLIMDSLRYWVQEMHVDGFRFDLAPALAREMHDVHRLSSFFDTIHQDPIISRVKLIAEPWDIGEGGYQVGNFPVLWAEWNDRYRDTVRAFWRGDDGQMGELAYRLTGSSDLYEEEGRRPSASINFVTAHDGFTLHDLVTYDHRHNEANGEHNQDGHSHNISWNHGVEGETDDPAINALRQRQKRNFLATLLLSQGVPMISGGDEIARTQRGNNNAYGQDNEISWYDWDLDDARRELLAFVQRLIALRHEHPALRRRRFFQGRAIHGSDIRDITWVGVDGRQMDERVWDHAWVKSFGMLLGGDALDDLDRETGEPLTDDTLLLLVNGHHDAVCFTLPQLAGRVWDVLTDTQDPRLGEREPHHLEAGMHYELAGRCIALLRGRGGAARGRGSGKHAVQRTTRCRVNGLGRGIMKTVTLKVEGMTCDHCARAVGGALERVAGVRRAQVDLAGGRALVEYDEERTTPSALANAVMDEGYTAEDLP
jgi:isoamylase